MDKKRISKEALVFIIAFLIVLGFVIFEFITHGLIPIHDLKTEISKNYPTFSPIHDLKKQIFKNYPTLFGKIRMLALFTVFCPMLPTVLIAARGDNEFARAIFVLMSVLTLFTDTVLCCLIIFGG